MTDFSSKTCCVCDGGLFAELAETLSHSFGKVYYSAPWVTAFPSSYQVEIGEGFPNFERVQDIWEIVDTVDLFVFPDMFDGPLQTYLIWNGRRVFGARYGDELENFRSDAKKLFDELGIAQGPYKVVKGIKQLREYIKSRGSDKLWVKINLTRKDTETFRSEGYALVKNRLDQLEAKLGPVAEYREFIVEDDLPDTVDLCLDTFSIDGECPNVSILGHEEKDKCYVAAVKKWDELPAKMRDIYEKLSLTLKNYSYRGFLSLECRCGQDNIWLTDPCCRGGSPTLELQLNMIENLPEILWEGAEGKVVDPEFVSPYGFELVVNSDWADINPVKIEFPDEFREQIKLRYAAQYPDGIWTMPQGLGPPTLVATVVATGENLQECYSEAEEISEQVKGIDLHACTDCIPEANKSIEKLAEWGIIL